MTVILAVIVVACLAGVVRGGTMHNLAQLHLDAWPLVFAALAVQALGAFAGTLGLPGARGWYVAGMIASATLVTTFVLRNRALPGMPLIALGFVLNALVVTANGAMPVDEKAANRIGLSVIGLYAHTDAKHELADSETRLRPLADIVPVPLPGPLQPGSNVLSVGDVVLAAGIGVLVLNGMLNVRSRREPKHLRQA